MQTESSADHTHDLAEFFRRECAPVQKSDGAMQVAEELTKLGMLQAAAVAIKVSHRLALGERESAS